MDGHALCWLDAAFAFAHVHCIFNYLFILFVDAKSSRHILASMSHDVCVGHAIARCDGRRNMPLSRWKTKTIGKHFLRSRHVVACVELRIGKRLPFIRQASEATHVISESVRFRRLNTVEWMWKRLPMETERTKQNALWSLCSFMALLFSHRPEPPPQKSEFPTDIETLSRMNVNSREHENMLLAHSERKICTSQFCGRRSLRALEMWFWCERW